MSSPPGKGVPCDPNYLSDPFAVLYRQKGLGREADLGNGLSVLPYVDVNTSKESAPPLVPLRLPTEEFLPDWLGQVLARATGSVGIPLASRLFHGDILHPTGTARECRDRSPRKGPVCPPQDRSGSHPLGVGERATRSRTLTRPYVTSPKAVSRQSEIGMSALRRSLTTPCRYPLTTDP
jgi:hypothetical protein